MDCNSDAPMQLIVIALHGTTENSNVCKMRHIHCLVLYKEAGNFLKLLIRSTFYVMTVCNVKPTMYMDWHWTDSGPFAWRIALLFWLVKTSTVITQIQDIFMFYRYLLGPGTSILRKGTVLDKLTQWLNSQGHYLGYNSSADVILQQKQVGVEEVTVVLEFPTPVCTMRCTLILTQKRTLQVSTTLFLWTHKLFMICDYEDFPTTALFIFTVSSAGSSTGRRRKQRIIPTNDELLYDPDEDDRDQAWVDARRKRWDTAKESLTEKIIILAHFNRIKPLSSCSHDLDFLCRYICKKRTATTSQPQPHNSQALPNSDAILNCPACMTTLCLDCQRWELTITRGSVFGNQNGSCRSPAQCDFKIIISNNLNRLQMFAFYLKTLTYFFPSFPKSDWNIVTAWK